MAEFEDLYEILGVKTNATNEEIKSAYRDKCFILHPDRLQGAPDSAKKRAELELVKLNKAYAILKDPKERQQYYAEWLKQKGNQKTYTQSPKARPYSPPPPSSSSSQSKQSANKVRLEYCPDCKQRSLFWNQTNGLWECLNKECLYVCTSKEFSEYWHNKQVKEQPVRQGRPAQRGTHIVFPAPLWLVNILESKRFWKLLICSAVIWWCWAAIQYSGNSIGLAIGLTIPILLLYAIRIILRKFLTGYNGLASQHHVSQIFYSIRKSSFLRFMIILATIALLVTTIWSISIFIYKLIYTSPAHPLVYKFNMLIIIIAQIWLLSWLCGILKHSQQLSSKPKFAVVFCPLFAVAVFCAFVGISPFSDIKNTSITTITNWWEQSQTKTATENPAEPPSENLPPSSTSPTSTLYENNKSKYPHRVWTNDYTNLAKGNGQPVELYENPDAKDPTWEQLKSFLETDNTDKITYVPGSFVCIDFAETLHNNAERFGIRCGLVVLYPILHACNAFETTDRGLLFIDCTSSRYQAGPYDEDTIITVQLGADYIPRYIFSNRLGNTTWTVLSMGTVTRYQICWVAGEIMDYQYDYAIASIPSYIPPYVPPPSFVLPSYVPHYVPPSSSYVPPYTPPTTPSTSTPVCRPCCEDRCSKYQGVWRNGCIDDCMKGGTEKWSWE